MKNEKCKNIINEPMVYVEAGNYRLTRRMNILSEKTITSMEEAGMNIEKKELIYRWNKGYKVKKSIRNNAMRQIAETDKNKQARKKRGLYPKSLFPILKKLWEIDDDENEEYMELLETACSIASQTNMSWGWIEDNEYEDYWIVVFSIFSEDIIGDIGFTSPKRLDGPDGNNGLRLSGKSLFDSEGNLNYLREPTTDKLMSAVNGLSFNKKKD